MKDIGIISLLLFGFVEGETSFGEYLGLELDCDRVGGEWRCMLSVLYCCSAYLHCILEVLGEIVIDVSYKMLLGDSCHIVLHQIDTLLFSSNRSAVFSCI